jgi:hypothetical protein
MKPWNQRKTQARKAVWNFDSKQEKVFAERELAGLEERGIKCEREVTKVTFTPPSKSRTKLWDFTLTLTSGKVIVIEYKGWWDRDTRLKEIMAIEQNPGIDVRYVFSNAETKIYKSSPTTYGDYCAKRGIRYSTKTIPLNWLLE